MVLDVLKNHNHELALRAACRLLAELATDRANSEAMRVGNAQERLEKVAKDLYDDEPVRTKRKKKRGGNHALNAIVARDRVFL